jgi:hypothetical protein
MAIAFDSSSACVWNHESYCQGVNGSSINFVDTCCWWGGFEGGLALPGPPVQRSGGHSSLVGGGRALPSLALPFSDLVDVPVKD